MTNTISTPVATSTFGTRLASGLDPRQANWAQRGLQAFAVVGIILLLLALIGGDDLPWSLAGPLALLAVALWALGALPRLQMALTAGLVAFLLFWVGPTLVRVLPNSLFVEGEVALRLLLFILAVSALAGCAACCWHWRDLLLGPPLRGSFAIDMTILVAAYIVVAFAEVSSGLSPSSITSPEVLYGLAWVVPLGLWVAFTCRQGGVLAIGSAAGLVSFYVLVWVFPEPFFGSAAQYLGAFGAPRGNPALAIIAVALLAVAIWWALSPRVVVPRDRLAPDASASINGTSVVAFIAAWIPLTAIPGIVLGHMAYDQVAGNSAAQRGLGLARWAIVIGYLALGGAAFLYFTILL